MSIIHRHIILIGQTTINIEYGISNIIYSLYQTSILTTNLTYPNINKCAYFPHNKDYTCSLLRCSSSTYIIY